MTEWQFESLIYIMVAGAFLLIAPTLAEGAHVRADLLVARLKGKAHLSTELFVEVFGLAVATIVLISGVQQTQFLYEIGQTTESGVIPLWILVSALPFSFLFYIAYAMKRVYRRGSALLSA